MTTPLALALALAAPLALAQAPGPTEQAPAAKPPAKPATAPQKGQKPRSEQGTPKAHAKPTPEQIRRFNELQQQGGKQ